MEAISITSFVSIAPAKEKVFLTWYAPMIICLTKSLAIEIMIPDYNQSIFSCNKFRTLLVLKNRILLFLNAENLRN